MVDIVSKLKENNKEGKVMNMANVKVTDSYQAIKSETRDLLTSSVRVKKPYKDQYRDIPRMSTKTPSWSEVGVLLAQLNADETIPDNKSRNLVEVGILKRLTFDQARLIKNIKLFGIHNLIPTRHVDAFRCMCRNGTFPDVRVSLLKREDGTESIRIYTNKGFIEIIKLK